MITHGQMEGLIAGQVEVIRPHREGPYQVVGGTGNGEYLVLYVDGSKNRARHVSEFIGNLRAYDGRRNTLAEWLSKVAGE